MCDGRNHNLIEVHRSTDVTGISSVVRWCKDCGAVVVDGEFDGRIRPGDILPMTFPSKPIIWWPYETAPKQGTFLVQLPDESVHVAVYHPKINLIGNKFDFDLPTPIKWANLHL